VRRNYQGRHSGLDFCGGSSPAASLPRVAVGFGVVFVLAGFSVRCRRPGQRRILAAPPSIWRMRLNLTGAVRTMPEPGQCFALSGPCGQPGVAVSTWFLPWTRIGDRWILMGGRQAGLRCGGLLGALFPNGPQIPDRKRGARLSANNQESIIRFWSLHFSRQRREVGHPGLRPKVEGIYLNDFTAAASSSFTSKTV
jgi:hypothetical protein